MKPECNLLLAKNALRECLCKHTHDIVTKADIRTICIHQPVDNSKWILHPDKHYCQQVDGARTNTHNSPLRIISQTTRTCPCLQTARKIPAIANRANIFLRASGPVFHQRSTQVFTHCARSSISATFNQAISPSSSPSLVFPTDSDVVEGVALA